MAEDSLRAEMSLVHFFNFGLVFAYSNFPLYDGNLGFNLCVREQWVWSCVLGWRKGVGWVLGGERAVVMSEEFS